MSLQSFTNLSLDRCFFSQYQFVKYLFSRIGCQWVVNNSYCAKKFSLRGFLLGNPLLFTRINYFLKLSLFPRDRSAVNAAS